MMMLECEYEFTPPDGSASIKVLGMQPYSPDQTRKAQVWKLEPGPAHAARFGSGPREYDKLQTVVATLANMFCGGDQKAASHCLVLKFDQRR